MKVCLVLASLVLQVESAFCGRDFPDTSTFAIETLRNGELASVGALEFHFAAKQIRYVSFADGLFKPKVQTILFIIKVTRFERVSDRLITFSGTNEFGFKVAGTITRESADDPVPRFEISIGGRSNVLIRPLSEVGQKYYQTYLPGVYLGETANALKTTDRPTEK